MLTPRPFSTSSRTAGSGPGRRAPHLRRRAGGRVRLVRRRGRGLLRRAPDVDRRGRLLGRARAARGAAPGRRAARRAVRELAQLDERASRAGREHGGGDHRGGARVDARPGRTAGRRGNHPRDRARRALAGLQLLPRRPAQPNRRQRGPPDLGDARAPARDARVVPRPPRGARVQGAPPRAWPRVARGDDRARACAAGARVGGDRRDRSDDAARGRRRIGAGRGSARRRHRARPRARSRGRPRRRAVRVGARQRSVAAAREGSERGRDEGLSRALGPGDAATLSPVDPLPDRADLSELRADLLRGTRAVPLVRGGRAGPLPPPADRAGAVETCSSQQARRPSSGWPRRPAPRPGTAAATRAGAAGTSSGLRAASSRSAAPPSG